ncbi:serine acetyltransferase [Pedobacter chinensis]|uniref:Serine acetyltransferase n=1 Tax=Pedobacter chinensis TaxID=2282421 RepID=A0A369PPR8_9SPHI|nr:DapH/DapD/GlmU-related protein [Pedobacter chinensis]RDC54282.1 serine acetyltransferase [Pedobacter chinensis]
MSYINKKRDVFQDWAANHHNLKGRVLMVFFRCASLIRRNLILRIIFFWYLLLYKFIIGWILNIDISARVRIGPGLKLVYGYGSVIDGATTIGTNCTLRHLTTITCKMLEDGTSSPAPVIGDNVDIGVNATIIGDIKIGNNVIIGAGAVVTKDVENNCVIGGNPAVVIKMVYKFPLDENLSIVKGSVIL